MKLSSRLSYALVILMLALSLSFAQKPQPAPPFKLKAQNGKIVELAKLKGKVVAVNFWATWCGPCRKEIPGMMEVYQQYKAKGLEIVGVSLDQNGWEDVNPFLQKMPITYPVVIGDEALAVAYQMGNAIPVTYLVDKKGNIAKKHLGYLNKADFEAAVKSLL